MSAALEDGEDSGDDEDENEDYEMEEIGDDLDQPKEPTEAYEHNEQLAEIDDSTDSRGIPGWKKVDRLAKALVDMKGISLSNAEKSQIITLYNNLDEYDKKPLNCKVERFYKVR